MSGQAEVLLNDVLIEMSCSFLQYVSESSPWVRIGAQSIDDQVNVLAARQRQDVSDIATMLTDREHYIDFGSFPTEYTDLQFLSLKALFDKLHCSQNSVCNRLASSLNVLTQLHDEAAAQLISIVEGRQREIATALKELQQELQTSASAS